MVSWFSALKGYLKPQVLVFLFLGFSCGIPYNLLAATFSLWLTDSGLTLAVIGLSSLVLIPYSFRFLWAPLVDNVRLPFLSDKFGLKKSWGIVFQIGLLISVIGLAFSNPSSDFFVYRFESQIKGQDVINVLPLATFFWAFLAAFFAASQDIVVDALRVDTLNPEEYGQGAGLYQYGYRMGMLLSGAGVIALASYVPWCVAYLCAGCGVFVGLVALLAVKTIKETHRKTSFRQMVVEPIKDFAVRHQWVMVLSFVVLYKMCNSVLGKMATVFYRYLDFSNNEIALISGTIGPVVTMLGVAVGGVVVMRYSVLKCLFWLGCVECLTSLAFALFFFAGHSIAFYCLVIVFDNIVGGMGGTVFVAYLTSLCSRKFSATQYALLSSLIMLPMSVAASYSGFLAEMLGWYEFFIMTGFLMVPALFLLLVMMRQNEKLEKNRKNASEDMLKITA